jgi:hypothetical protein
MNYERCATGKLRQAGKAARFAMPKQPFIKAL